MEVINPEEFEVIRNEDGAVVILDKKICLQNKESGSVLFMQPTAEVLKTFNLWGAIEFIEPQTAAQSAAASSVGENCTRGKWCREAILCLIHLRKKYNGRFLSTTVKNDSVWNELAAEMQANTYSAATNGNILNKSIQKKDNMSDKQTGTEAIKFDFFPEMDEFLRQRHNIVPVAVAASITGTTMPNSGEEDILQDNEEASIEAGSVRKKQKLEKRQEQLKENKSEEYIREMKEEARQKEEKRNERHAVRREAIDVFSAKLDKL